MTRSVGNVGLQGDDRMRVSRAGRPVDRQLMTVLWAALCIVTVVAVPANAHAQLERSTPSGNERVTGKVPSIVFRYSENVTVIDGTLRLTGPGVLTRPLVPTGAGPAPSVEAVPGPLPDGAYVAQVDVVSEDGHHVSAATAFTIESSGVTPSSAPAPTTKPARTAKTTKAAKTTKTTKTTKTAKPKRGATSVTATSAPVIPLPKPGSVAITGEGIAGTVRLTPTGRPHRYRIEVESAKSTTGGTLANLTLRMAVPEHRITGIEVPLVPDPGGQAATAADAVIPALGTYQLVVGATVGMFDAFTGTGTFRLD